MMAGAIFHEFIYASPSVSPGPIKVRWRTSCHLHDLRHVSNRCPSSSWSEQARAGRCEPNKLWMIGKLMTVNVNWKTEIQATAQALRRVKGRFGGSASGNHSANITKRPTALNIVEMIGLIYMGVRVAKEIGQVSTQPFGLAGAPHMASTHANLCNESM